MQITRSSNAETALGPGEWFTGTVYIDTVATPSGPSRLGAASVHFAPGARTAWHTHPFGQNIFVTEGVGLCERRGGTPDRFMTHIAMQEADDSGSPVSWGEHVPDNEYGATPAIDG